MRFGSTHQIKNPRQLLQSGETTFNSTTGITINLQFVMPSVDDYEVEIFPSEDPSGYLGEYWIVKATDSFTVYNSGTAKTKFRYRAVTLNPDAKAITTNHRHLVSDLSDTIPASKLHKATNAERIQPSNLSDAVLAMMAGTTPVNATPEINSVTTEKIANLAVTTSKTDFFKDGNLFDSITVKTGGYYSSGTGAWIANASYNSSDFIEVIPGQTYYMKSASLASTHIAFFQEDKTIFVSGISATAVNNIVTFTVPNKNHIKYVTLLVLSGQINSTILSIGNVDGNYNTVKKLLASSLIFDKHGLITHSATDFLSISDKLFDKTAAIMGGAYVNGVWVTNAEYASSDFIQVWANEVFEVTSSYTNINHVNLWDENKVFLGTATIVITDGTIRVITITIPDNADVAYMTFLFTPGQLNTLVVTPVNPRYKLARQLSMSDVKGIAETFAKLKNSINNITDTAGVQWYGKKWFGFGTSLTDTANEGKYPNYLAALSGLIYTNHGISGATIKNQILPAMQSTDLSLADLITFEGSVNDWITSVPIGTAGDTTTETFAGAVYSVIKHLYENSTATIIGITEHTGRTYTFTEGPNAGNTSYCYTAKENSLGLTQGDYINMFATVCEYMNCPVIRAGQKSMINEFNPAYYIDNIHHSELGGKQYANTIWDELKNIHLRILA